MAKRIASAPMRARSRMGLLQSMLNAKAERDAPSFTERFAQFNRFYCPAGLRVRARMDAERLGAEQRDALHRGRLLRRAIEGCQRRSFAHGELQRDGVVD